MKRRPPGQPLSGAMPHRGLRRDFRALSARFSVTLSAGTP
eukprot:CAMPEP_0180213644 /NCGR_PEP_ID=MMETSP0987-20121128/14344_1 /TAXON_ID=697907 /ORGANISM="non described non described, Strain CCMP2293" /LENGTH=39 /DNA_ID= /DNA_START= /DNA_END= /DNA_ORIENTATION=